MRCLVLILLNSILAIGCSQVRKTDLNNLNLNNQVQSIKVQHYSFNIQDSIVLKESKEWGCNEKQKLNYYAEFNTLGFYTQIINYYNPTKTDTNRYLYNENGFLRCIISYDTTIVKCNRHGNITESKFRYGASLHSKYNSNGNLVYSEFSDGDNLLSKYKAVFKKDKLYSETDFDADGNLISKKNYNYTSDPKQTEITYYEANKNIVSKAIATKDSLENVILINYQDSSGNVFATESFVYEYDNRGNWTKQYKYIDNKPELLTERTITYY